MVLVKRPQGVPEASCWKLVEAEEVPELSPSHALVEVLYLSIDPAMRAWLDEDCHVPPVAIGETMRALGVGRVLSSDSPALKPGDHVSGPLGVQKFAHLPGILLQKIDEQQAPPSAYAGVLGLTGGITAYFGILDRGAVQPGETVVVSAAAGCVGSIAGQIAKIRGARVIGIAGGAYKVRHVIDELGFDDCIDYKAEEVHASLGEKAPDGVDVYFDNVGGDILDAVLDHIREEARIVICGAISQYNNMDRVQGPSLYLRLAEHNSKMLGYSVTYFISRLGEAQQQLAQWLGEGKLKAPEHVEHGVENLHATMLKLFDGSHIGKLLLQP
jgi:NADPH-dependent curcumin reductase CurA